MTNWNTRLLVALVAVMVGSCLATTTALAATGNQGYAVYRDGVGLAGANWTWHAALMREPHKDSDSYPVIQAVGWDGNVKFDTWSHFLSGNSYMGTYRPKTAPTSADRDNFVYRGRMLVDDQIPYGLTYQVYYDTSNSGSRVDPCDITKMRCDGVIEYIYEWYGFRVYGDDDHWDITRVGYWNRDAHSGNAVNPKSQAQSYLTKVTSSLP